MAKKEQALQKLFDVRPSTIKRVSSTTYQIGTYTFHVYTKTQLLSALKRQGAKKTLPIRESGWYLGQENFNTHTACVKGKKYYVFF